LIATLLERGRRRDVAEALEQVERSRSRLLLERLQSAMEGRMRTQDAATSALRGRLAALRAGLSRGYHRLHAFDENDRQRLLGAGETRSEALLPLEQDYQATLRRLELAELESAPGPSLLTPLPSVEALQAALRPTETLLEYYISGEEVCAFVLTRDG